MRNLIRAPPVDRQSTPDQFKMQWRVAPTPNSKTILGGWTAVVRSKTGGNGAISAALGLFLFLSRLLLDARFVAVILNQIVKQGKGAKHNDERERKAVKRVSPELYLPAIPNCYAQHHVSFPVH
jgi:hypothetical protein